MKELIEEIRFIYLNESNGPFSYEDFRQFQDDFSDEFRNIAPCESINADFNSYMMYIYGLSSGGVIKKLEYPLDRYKMKEWLNKSFFDWFPKYRFLESYDLRCYKGLNKEWDVIEKLRFKLIELIKLKEDSK